MLERKTGETYEQYLWRLGELKTSGAVDLSWDDIADIINQEFFGTDYDSYKGACAYRKTYSSAKKFYEAGVFDEDINDDHLVRIQREQDRLFKERKKYYDQRREYNKLLTTDAREEHLFDELIDVANRMATETPLPFDPVEFPEYNKKEGLLLLSDWHYGMVTDNIWNKYNTDICRERVQTLVEYVKHYAKEQKINVLNIALLGDAAHGAIHVGCRIQSEEDTCDQLMHVSEILAETIAELSTCVNKVNVYSCYGNHLRTVQKKDESKHSDNLEKIIPWWIKERLKNNSKVNIIESPYKEFTRIDILGSKICCVHGDLDNFKNLGVTVNTIFNKVYGESIDYTVSGDKHHLEEFESFGIESILVRSLCGTDEYANNKRLYSDAGQTLIIFNDDYGRECTYHIPLS